MWPKQQLHHHHVPSSWSLCNKRYESPSSSYEQWTGTDSDPPSLSLLFSSIHSFLNTTQKTSASLSTQKWMPTDLEETGDRQTRKHGPGSFFEAKRESSKCEECLGERRSRRKKKKEGKKFQNFTNKDLLTTAKSEGRRQVGQKDRILVNKTENEFFVSRNVFLKS